MNPILKVSRLKRHMLQRPELNKLPNQNFTFLRFRELPLVKPVGFGVSPDLVVSGDIVEDSGGLDARGHVADAVTLD